MNIQTEKKIAASLSITSNALIILFKIIAGVMTGCMSIMSEAVHSFSDFIASLLTFFAVSRSAEPADRHHQFGHGKYEDMSGFIEGGLIILAAVYILIEAGKKLIFGYQIDMDSYVGIYAMGFAVISNIFVSYYLFKVAKKSNSISLYADAEHLRTDVLSSFAVLLGLVLIKITRIMILDAVIAIIVAGIILKAGYSIVKETLNNLLDGSLPQEEIEKIESIIDTHEEIKGYKDIKTRRSGPSKDLDITIIFEGDMTIKDCHKICDSVEHEIQEALGHTNTTIHSEPENKD